MTPQKVLKVQNFPGLLPEVLINIVFIFIYWCLSVNIIQI